MHLHHVRILLAVTFQHRRFLALELGEARLDGLDVGILEDGGNGVGRGVGAQVPHLIVERLLLNAIGLGLGDRVVQLVEARDHDVLAVLERERVLVFAILRHCPLAVFDLLLLLHEFLRQPLEARHHVLAPQLEVLLHVLVGEGIDRASGEGGFSRNEGHVHETAVLHRIDADARQKRANHGALGGIAIGSRQGRQLRRSLTEWRRDRVLHRRYDAIDSRRRRSSAVELRHLAEIESMNDPASELAAGKDPVLRLVVDLRILPVVAADRVDGPGDGRRTLVLQLDHQPGLRAVQGHCRVRPQQHAEHDKQKDADRDVAIFVEDVEVIEDVAAVIVGQAAA